MSLKALRRLGFGIAAVVSAAILALPASSTEPRKIRVQIQDFIYDPALVAARAGDVVTWTNGDIVPHTVTAQDGSWDSGEIGPGETWSLILGEDTSAAYFCIYHPGMRSRLAITPGS